MPTPIGNPEDISLRALRILREVDLIAAEHPAVSRRLLERYGLTTPMRRCGAVQADIAEVLAQLTRGLSVALVCDAGVPVIADPGGPLIRAALNAGIPVASLPGPTAVMVALAASGLPAQRFAFDGFPPRSRTDRAEFFRALASESRTIVLCESAAYLRSTLRALHAAMGGGRQVAVACNLTTPGEMLWRGTLAEAVPWADSNRPKGQFSLVIAPRQSP